jgi:hypothetical protein
MAPPTFAVDHTRTAKCPELLCLTPALLVPGWHSAPPRRALLLLHRSYKLMRQTSSLRRTSWFPTYFPRSLQVAASPCRSRRNVVSESPAAAGVVEPGNRRFKELWENLLWFFHSSVSFHNAFRARNLRYAADTNAHKNAPGSAPGALEPALINQLS